LLPLPPCAAADGAQARAGEWVSYRDAYRAMVRFEKYGGPKHLLVSQLQVLTKDGAALGEGAQLTLAGKTTQLNLPLDALGRTVFPLQKAAYDDNAALLLNRKGVAFTLRPQVSIAARADGQYEAAELRAACGQALAFARWSAAAADNLACAGVRFVFARKAEAGVTLRRADSSEQALASGPAEEGLAGGAAVVVRFGPERAERAQVVTANAPLAILPLIEAAPAR
jgi:hypothetical protein